MKLHFSQIPAVLALAALLAATRLADAATYTWNVTSGNWSTPASWTLTTTGPNGPLATDSVVFGANDTSSSSTTVNNTVDSGFAGTITGLTYNSISASAFNVTQIGSGQTLTVTGPVLVGGVNGVSTAIMTDTADTATARDTAGARRRLERRVPTIRDTNNIIKDPVSGH